ncbi:MAG: hypothetical protein FWG65_03920 [Turicibacter sp.]|nr:hypothetical protein [Turicibacter sp.]
MLDKYVVRCENVTEPIGTLEVDVAEDYFNIDINPNYDGPKPLFMAYPKAVMPLQEQVKIWVLERSPEPHYEFIDALVEKAGLDKYDPYGFFKYNKGRFITDKFYVEEV